MLLWGITLTFLSSQAQTFSHRSQDNLLSVYLGVTLLPFGYQTYGVRIDTAGGYQFTMIVRNFNESGQIIETKDLYFDNKQYNPNGDINCRLNDSVNVCVVIDIEDGIDTIYNTMLWLNNDGDTIFTKRYHSPFHVDNNTLLSHFRPTCVTASADGENIYFAAQIGQGNPAQNNFIIKKLTNQGEEVWTYVNPLDPWYSYCNAIQFYQGQIWFIAMASGNQGHYNELRSLNDETGEESFAIEHQGDIYPIGGCGDMLIDESGVVISTVKNLDGLVPHIFKINLEGEYDWYTVAPESGAPFQYNEHLVQSPAGGYVSCSVKYDEIPNPNDPNDPAANNTSEKIWLWKVDGDGVFQWQRFYEYLSFDSGYFYLENIAHDLKATPDGGYIMAGESKARCLEWPCLAGDPFTQQGWLLKVDGCGCLVPGCDEMCVVDVTENEKEKHDYFKFGPNPVRQNLNVYIPKNTLYTQSLSLEFRNLQGQLIKSFPLKHDDTTYIIDTGNLSSGQYMLSLVFEGEILQTEIIAVGK